MSDKNFKLKPTTWPKEYSFEEYRGLNPNINENILINYYNKYLQEYAEDRSRHINHFNDIKDNLSKELLTLKESTGKFRANIDGDGNVGPTGAGRIYHKPLPADNRSVYFDGIDDSVYVNENLSSSYSGPGSPLRPLDKVTIAAWYRSPTAYLDTGTPYYYIYDSYHAGGFYMLLNNSQVKFTVATDKGDGTSLIMSASSHTKVLGSQYLVGSDTNQTDPNDYPRVYGHPSKNDWHLFVGTYDNKSELASDGTYTASIKIYVDGEIGNKKGHINSPLTLTDADGYGKASMDRRGSSGLNVSGAQGTIFYDGLDGINPGRSKFSPMVGKGSVIDHTTGIITHTTTNATTHSIAEIAVWNTALSAEAIKDLYNGTISSSKGARYDLNYSGHPNSFQYDIYDEGLDYTNIGQYSNNLQLWYQFEDIESSSIALDSSKKGNHGVYKNHPKISGSFSYKTN